MPHFPLPNIFILLFDLGEKVRQSIDKKQSFFSLVVIKMQNYWANNSVPVQLKQRLRNIMIGWVRLLLSVLLRRYTDRGFNTWSRERSRTANKANESVCIQLDPVDKSEALNPSAKINYRRLSDASSSILCGSYACAVRRLVGSPTLRPFFCPCHA